MINNLYYDDTKFNKTFEERKLEAIEPRGGEKCLNKRVMTCNQEVANAISMAFPLVYAAIMFDRAQLNSCSWVLLAAVAQHLPWSVAYHLRVAMSAAGVAPLKCPVDNPWRRLDQTAMHVVCIMWAFVLSGGRHPPYLIFSTLFNLRAISQLWEVVVVPPRNQRNLFVGMLVYLAPVICRGDLFNLIGALSFVLPGIFIFATYAFGGYSHAIFHVYSIGYLHYLVAATQAIGDSGACTVSASSGAFASMLALTMQGQ